jgi:TonB family protein
VLPADFEARYPADQASLVVAHERAHVRRGDVRANLLMAALRCLHWFNPLLHAAAARFRLDQELACDATVLARHPHARRAYADAMLNTQLAVPGLPVGCHWQSSRSLKERILMLKRPLPGRARRIAGQAMLAVALAAGSYGAWALQPAAADQAPAYLGNVLWGNMADVDVRLEQKNAEPIGVFGGSMARKPDGTTRVHMNGVSPLSVEIGEGEGQLVFEAQATNTVSEKPIVAWTLARQGQRIDQGRIELSHDPQVLVVGGAGQGTASSATLTFVEAAGTTLSGSGAALLEMDGSGLYALKDSVVVGDEFKVAGSADLLLHVSARGSVSKVDVERVSPAQAFTQEQADDYVHSMRFRPFTRGGTPTAGLVRTTVHFAPTMEALRRPPAWFEPAADQGAKKGSQDLKAPKYPADAAKDKVSGKVVLVIDVGVDGRATQVQVESSQPAGVFDQAAIGAARDWTFKPIMKDGKPVEGRVRVPITFDASGSPDGESGIAGDSAYDWIRLEKHDPAVVTAVCDMATGDRNGGNLHCGRLRPAHATR